MVDLVYPVKRDAPNDYLELQYSLRTVAKNLPHRQVILAGGMPDWATNVIHLDPEPGDDRWLDADNNVMAAVLDPRVSDPFVLMNDDFFVLQPVEGVPVMNRGLVSDVMQYPEHAPSYRSAMEQSLRVLEDAGYPEPLSFELHVPMVVSKAAVVAAMEMGRGLRRWMWRTALGNIEGYVGETIRDVKVYDHAAGIPDGPWASSSDKSFALGLFGKSVKRLFNKPCEYELA